MTGLIALIRKDLLLFLGNRRALIMTLLAPVLIAAFFGSLFGSDARVSQVPVAIADLDDSPLTRRIVASMQGESAVRVSLMGASEADAAVRAGRVKAAITLPAGFGVAAPRAVFGGAAAPIIVVQHDPSQSTVLPLVRGLLAQHVMQPVTQAAFNPEGGAAAGLRTQVEQAGDAIDGGRRRDLLALADSLARVQGGAASAASGAGAGGGLSTPYTTQELEAAGPSSARQEAGRGYNSYAHSFAGMGVQFILLQGVEIGVALLLMRRSALWLRLRAAPLTRVQLLGSRLLSFALIAAGVFTVLYAIAMLGFGVRVQGSWAGLVAIVAAFSLMSAAFGLMIASLGRSPEATRGLAILVTLLLVMVGGAWVPTFLFPPWLQTVAAWTPTHWAVTGLDAMTWRAQPWDAAVAPTGALLGFAVAFAAVTLATFRWEE